MPGLVRKLVIFAAVDGLILQPLAQRGQRPAPATRIGWDGSIGPALKDEVDSGSSAKGFEAFGIVGKCKKPIGKASCPAVEVSIPRDSAY
jgi:hypothetical protein